MTTPPAADAPRRHGPFGPMTRGAAQAAVFLFFLSVLLAGAAFFLSVRTVQSDISSRASVVQLCKTGNEFRAQQLILWEHIIAISVPPPHETPAQRKARQLIAREFLAYVRQVFSQRDCSRLPAG